MGRLALVLAAAGLLGGGLASAILAASPQPAATTTAATTTAATTVAPVTTTVSTASTVLGFTGHGWGHGMGMSQYGAYGYAQHGWTHDKILAHYYPATTLGDVKAQKVRVLVAQTRTTTLASSVAWTVTDATGAQATLAPGSLLLGPRLKPKALPAARQPLVFKAAQPISVAGAAYRGVITVSSDGSQLSIVDTLSLESYLDGVVPAEMPKEWPAEALEAQAIAARSYALANLHRTPLFDLYGDTRDQAYGGVAVEADTTTAAVAATKGKVVLYDGKVADTLFSSTSGGRTVSSLEARGIAVPYLVSVPDPYDSVSPVHDWGPVLFDAAKVAKALKLTAPISGVAAVAGPSGHIATMTLTGSGSSATLSGGAVRNLLGLRSTWFTPALLQLRPAAKTVPSGGSVSLDGVVQGTSGVSLEAKASSGAGWITLGAVVPAANGAFSMVVRPEVSTQYRLAWGDVRAGLAKIAVQ